MPDNVNVPDRTSKVARIAPVAGVFVVLAALGLSVNAGRLGFDLAGGRLLEAGSLSEVWSAYLAGWHAVDGGTASAAPAALAVLGTFGAVFTPHGFVSLLMIADAPLAGVSAFFATRRLPVQPWVRAVIAAAYGLLPAATAAGSQGRLDVVAAHILLPPVIAGIAGVLADPGQRWLHSSSLCALGLALLGAFSPLAHLLALAGLVVGFVVLPSPAPLLKRAASVVIVVLVPLALLMPWPTVLVNHPALVLHGLSGPGDPVTAVDLAGLDPGGAGAWPAGLALLLAAVIAFAVRPSRAAGAGLAVVVLGIAGLLVVRLVEVAPLQGGPVSPGFAGVPLLVIGAGLLWIVLSACRGPVGKPFLAGGAVLLVALAVGVVVAGSGGPLHSGGGPALAQDQADELARTGRSVLVLDAGDAPALQTGGRMPRFGDEQLAVSAATPARLAGWQDALTDPEPGRTRAALSGAAASGALFVVLPAGADPRPIVTMAGDLASSVAPTSDGRPVLRLLEPGGQVVLIPPGVARQAVTAQAPTSTLGVTPVDAQLPDVRVRVSEGVPGRLLVLAAEQEDGWRAQVDGKPVPIVPAWGHQVAVAVPTTQAEVTLEHPSTLRDVLLLVQIAAALFTLLTAVPTRLREPRPLEPTAEPAHS
ncbi:hypothetical protein [Amycolatopsis thermoflava]|uniref:Glycosyltransferase n=1 Tax=Amycolatopsis thermoflava TaxID=84480 RepID=A0A3N2GZR7_9PSEU|nr:hypothetical protein [Amycolatopsis thermoflava]ROS42168.1 hypothetical protein EDD35_4552 [Amycolatopsis thermoflava]